MSFQSASWLLLLLIALTACQKRKPAAAGADSQWITYEAGVGKTNGAVHGPTRESLTPEAEASGRKFVRLDADGQFLEITATQPANTIVVRYGIPDAIFGGIDHRNDSSPDNAFDGNFGKGSRFQNLWIEHVKCGFWTTQGTEDMRVQGCRIRNIMADGLNFCAGTSRSVVEQCHLRNTGDDALATWSPNGNGTARIACVQNSFLNNTIETPWLANGIALYGGADHLVARNKITGTVFSGGGILVSSGFEAVPFSGTIRVEENSVADAGGDCYIDESVGGLWIHAKDSDMDATIAVSGLRITDSPKSAITIHGPKKAPRVSVRDVQIEGAGEFGIDIKPNAVGSLRASGLRIARTRLDPVHNASGGRFSVDIVEEK